MTSNVVVALLAGGFALVGSLGGIILSGRFAQRADHRRQMAEDERRWLVDRRRIYASYLGIASSMLKELDSIGVFLSYDGSAETSEENEALIAGRLFKYFQRWDDELEPSLVEVQLISTPKVADYAERASGALMEITGPVELRRPFTEYYPGWFQARDLLEVLRNAMRVELGVPESLFNSFPRSDDWPWLPERPSRESYVQRHPKS